MRYLTRKQENEIRSQIAAYNRRIYDLSRQKRFDNVFLPERIDAKSAIANVDNYPDLQRLRARLSRLDNEKNLRVKTNTKGLKYVVGVEKDLAAIARATNRERQKKHDELGAQRVIVGGKDVGDVATVYPERIAHYNPVKFGLKDAPVARTLKSYYKRDEKLRDKQEVLKANLLAAIKDQIPYASDRVRDMLASIDPGKIEQLFLTQPDLDFTFIYSLEEAMDKIRLIERVLSGHLPDKWEKIADTYYKNNSWYLKYN